MAAGGIATECGDWIRGLAVWAMVKGSIVRESVGVVLDGRIGIVCADFLCDC